MRTVAAIAVCIVLGVTCARLAVAGEQPPAGSAASAQVAATQGDELHFVSVLTLHGEVVSIDPANRLAVHSKGPEGRDLNSLRSRSEIWPRRFRCDLERGLALRPYESDEDVQGQWSLLSAVEVSARLRNGVHRLSGRDLRAPRARRLFPRLRAVRT